MDQRLRDWNASVDRIRRILIADWDPIGCGAPDNEYDGYVPRLYRLLEDGAGAEEIASRLGAFEREWMGLPERPDVNLRVAGMLLDVIGPGPRESEPH